MPRRHSWFWRAWSPIGVVLFLVISGSWAAAQNLNTSTPLAVPPAPAFTDQELTKLWYRSFRSAKYLKAGPDTGSIPICLNDHAILAVKTGQILARIHFIKGIPEPRSSVPLEQRYIYLFSIKFQNIPNNPLYKDWIRQFTYDPKSTWTNIKQIAVEVTISLDNGREPSAIETDSGIAFSIFSNWDIMNMPQNNYVDFQILYKFGASLSYGVSSNPLACS